MPTSIEATCGTCGAPVCLLECLSLTTPTTNSLDPLVRVRCRRTIRTAAEPQSWIWIILRAENHARQTLVAQCVPRCRSQYEAMSTRYSWTNLQLHYNYSTYSWNNLLVGGLSHLSTTLHSLPSAYPTFDYQTIAKTHFSYTPDIGTNTYLDHETAVCISFTQARSWATFTLA